MKIERVHIPPGQTIEDVKDARDEAAVAAVKHKCRAMLELDEWVVWCERPFNHDDIHEVKLDRHSFLRWSYAGRRVLPLDPEHEAREEAESQRRQEEYRQEQRDWLHRQFYPDAS